MATLDKEEREVSRAVEAGEWKSVRDRERELRRYREYAKATVRKDRTGGKGSGSSGAEGEMEQ